MGVSDKLAWWWDSVTPRPPLHLAKWSQCNISVFVDEAGGQAGNVSNDEDTKGIIWVGNNIADGIDCRQMEGDPRWQNKNRNTK